MIKIARIDGDGIGKEVTEAGVAVLESLDLNFDFIEAEAGRECFDKNGTTIPDETIKTARNAKATLFGAITSTPGQKSPIITLRQELDTYANLRPIKSFKGIDCLFDDLGELQFGYQGLLQKLLPCLYLLQHHLEKLLLVKVLFQVRD